MSFSNEWLNHYLENDIEITFDTLNMWLMVVFGENSVDLLWFVYPANI